MITKSPTCERCVYYNSISNECREQSSIHYKGIVNPFARACRSLEADAEIQAYLDLQHS